MDWREEKLRTELFEVDGFQMDEISNISTYEDCISVNFHSKFTMKDHLCFLPQ